LAKVTVITDDHAGADTQNYVYLVAGGHKHLLGSPVRTLTPTMRGSRRQHFC
jgi:hypothetical protein